MVEEAAKELGVFKQPLTKGMDKLIRHIIKSIFKILGLDISRIQKEENEVELGQYEALMLGVLSASGKINIVQIGANDGVHGDPLYEFVMKYKWYTKILLIEPQQEVIPYLKKNYLDHPDKIIANVAIGSQKILTLFRVKEECRSLFDIPQDCPNYVATVITSSDKEFVLSVLEEDKKHLNKNQLKKLNKELSSLNEAIESYKVPCKKLQQLIEEVNFGNKVDVLQVDAEGTDDIVIYNCSVDLLKPRIIHYEHINLCRNRNEKLKNFLSKYGYITFSNPGSIDTYAVLLPLTEKG